MEITKQTGTSCREPTATMATGHSLELKQGQPGKPPTVHGELANSLAWQATTPTTK
jgi:hypothetical protein